MKVQLKTGLKTVAAAGTRVALSTTSLWVRGLKVAAPAANSGLVFVGDVTVAAANGRILAAGDVLSLPDFVSLEPVKLNLKDVYVDAATNGDKLTFSYFEESL